MKMQKQDIDQREHAIRVYMNTDHISIDPLSWDRLMSIKAKIESDSRSNEVVIFKKECRIFYCNSKKRIHKRGLTCKEAVWLAVSEYCLDQAHVKPKTS
jgi:hypothetical protein